MLRLAEPVFYSIQGEGVHQGIPSFFIRLQGCLPKTPGCSYCDTPYARDLQGGTLHSIEEIVHSCNLPSSRVCLTGGEPLAQDILPLVKLLKKANFRVDIETNGCMPRPTWYSMVDSWIADMKCPSSKMDVWSREMEWYTSAAAPDQVKFAVRTPEDFEYAEMLISRNLQAKPWVIISPVLSPVEDSEERFTRIEAVNFTKRLRNVYPRIRFSLQIHKFLFPRDQRGV